MEMGQNNNNPTLGAAIIVKDEADNISGCLESIGNICSQIVIVDTGSADKTPQICSRHGAEVYFFKWNGSFSDARNCALSLMRTDWIIAIDADEELDKQSAEKVCDHFDDSTTGGINVRIISRLHDGTSATHCYTRIFRRNDAIRYTGRIHEQIRESIENAGFDILNSDSIDSNSIDSDIVIHHKGYINSSEKITRNREIISEELAINPDDDYLKFHLAETEFSSGNFVAAKDLFSGINKQKNLSQRQAEIARIRLAQIGLSDGQTDLIEEHLDFRSRDGELEGLRQYVLAAYYITEKKFNIAYDIFKGGYVNDSSLVDKAMLEKAIGALEELI